MGSVRSGRSLRRGELEEAVTDEQLHGSGRRGRHCTVRVIDIVTLGPWALRYAVADPERMHALILYDTFASFVLDDECPWGYPLDFIEQQFVGLALEAWGTGAQAAFQRAESEGRRPVA